MSCSFPGHSSDEALFFRSRCFLGLTTHLSSGEGVSVLGLLPPRPQQCNWMIRIGRAGPFVRQLLLPPGVCAAACCARRRCEGGQTCVFWFQGCTQKEAAPQFQTSFTKPLAQTGVLTRILFLTGGRGCKPLLKCLPWLRCIIIFRAASEPSKLFTRWVLFSSCFSLEIFVFVASLQPHRPPEQISDSK